MNIADLFSAPMTAQSRPPSGRQIPAQAGPAISRQQMGLGELLAALQVAQMPWVSTHVLRPWDFENAYPRNMDWEQVSSGITPVGYDPNGGRKINPIYTNTSTMNLANHNRLGIVR